MKSQLVVVLLVVVLSLVSESIAHNNRWHFEGHKRSLQYNEVYSSTEFSYEGDTGPFFWGSLNPNWTACSNGDHQSPLSLTKRNAEHENPHGLSLHYTDLTSPVELINNGHTFEIEVKSNVNGSQSHLSWDGKSYSLLQFHFHQTSEHHFGTHSTPIEMHLVHEGAEGNLLVLGVLFDRSSDTPKNPFLDQFWSHMPENEGTVEQDISILWNSLLDHLQLDTYWSYSGSLTTPPCKEGVQWIVVRKKMGISFQQWDIFANRFGYNARPTQPVNARLV